MGTTLSPTISGNNSDTITGNLTANGEISLRSGKITGKVAVPPPANTNYTGPAPSGGVVTTFTLPTMPTMPNNTPFDNQVGTANITNTQTISPGIYRKLALTGSKTLTFNGPGNYIFYDVDNGKTTNKFVFNFKNTSTGTINIFIINDARWGLLSVSTVNGNFPSRIYTEVHGNGSTFSGNSFDLQGPNSMPTGSYVWLGNVWAPNGGISIANTLPSGNSTPHIIGALWSGKLVTIKNDLKLVYIAPAADPSYITPYYPPPPSGKVDPANNVIGAELFALTQNPVPIAAITQNEIFILDGAGKVMIEVVSKTAYDNILKGQLIALGMTDTVNNGPHTFIITGFFPISNLTQLNNNARIQYVRPNFPALSNAGQVTTQGDSTMRSHNVRSRFGVDGSGVKIGVISDSYNSKLRAQDDVNQGDLPGLRSDGQAAENPEPVQVLADLSQRGNDEGRAMLQIVHDVAPKSKLAFRTGFLTAGDFAIGIQDLASPNLPGGRCDAIVDDLTYITEPFLRDGVVAQMVDQVVAQGVTYFSSAGNFGSKSYEAVFSGVTNTSLIPNGQIHKFGSTSADIYQTVKLKPGSYTIVLQWNDEFHSLGSVNGVQTDMDLYLVGSTGFTLFGFNRSNLFGDPFEVCPFTVTEETNVKLMVARASGTGNVRFKYIIFRGGATMLDYQTGTSSIVGHPNANGAIAVGAMLYANIPAVTPIWPGVAFFSSRGGTFTTQSTQRNKPEIVGPNGVNTTVNLGGAVFNDGDPYPNFFGTSAAAPHVAAVGALLIQGRKKFNLQTTVTPVEIRQQLISSAGKFSYLPGNFSFEGGYGYAQADSAMTQIANARPIISSLEAVVPGAQNGTQPFQVKLKGKYLTGNTRIYYNGKPVSTSVSADRTEATATIPPIRNGQDPPFQLYNPPKSPSKRDGGLSEALHFFSSIVDITVRAENKSRKYGQGNPIFTAEVLYNGVPMTNPDTLAKLKLDGANLNFTTIATAASNSGLYGIFLARTTPLADSDPLLTKYGFTFVSGTLSVGKMPLKITPNNKTVKYGDDLGEISYTYQLDPSTQTSATLADEVKTLHKKYLAGNGLIVLNGPNQNPSFSLSDLANMSTMASFQSVRNARKFVQENGQLKPLIDNINPTLIGNQRFFVDVSFQSLQNYKLDSAKSPLVQPGLSLSARGFLNIKALVNGNAKASLPNGQLQAMVNGQLMAMVNGQLQALVNGQLQALVNDFYVNAEDIVFQNGQLLALINGAWTVITNGQLQALVNGQEVTVQLSVTNGQLQAVVNGQLMALVNGQLQAVVNGQLLAVVNGQLQAFVNSQLMPIVNGQLQAMVNGQLQAMVNGQLLALVNGQLMVLVNGQLEFVQGLSLVNGQLQAIVNGQLQALVNGQLQAMVNGIVTNIPTTDITLVNGQLQAIVNGQLQALVNGQLQAIVNGQLQALVNGAGVAASSVQQLANGQLQALVNGTYIPIANGQLQALVNGQLLAMVNGQLMAVVNSELTFVVFSNGQLQALVNGQLQALVNGQLQAMVNGQLQAVNSYSIVNGQLQAIVNGETWVYANGQLLALVNGQLQALVNNFDVTGTSNNAKTLVVVDQDDINLQGGDIGAMFAMNMITGLDAGTQILIPGAFVNENFEVTYGLGQIQILKAPLTTTANDATKVYGDPNPAFAISYSGLAYNDAASDITTPPVVTTTATINTNVGTYPITIAGGSSNNYSFASYLPGTLTITKKTLIVTADNKTKPTGADNPPLTITYSGLVGDDTKDSVCIPYLIPPSPKVIDELERRTTYTTVKINNTSNVFYASPGQSLTLTGNWIQKYIYQGTDGCPGCITQLRIGMADEFGGNVFASCDDVSGLGDHSGFINNTFKAPSAPGVYYITQISTWWYTCPAPNRGDPPQIPIHNNGPNAAIAVVVVNVANERHYGHYNG
ncbi:MAG: MBG domain-containing protein [Chitinophagaceae bacterium]